MLLLVLLHVVAPAAAAAAVVVVMVVSVSSRFLSCWWAAGVACCRYFGTPCCSPLAGCFLCAIFFLLVSCGPSVVCIVLSPAVHDVCRCPRPRRRPRDWLVVGGWCCWPCVCAGAALAHSSLCFRIKQLDRLVGYPCCSKGAPKSARCLYAPCCIAPPTEQMLRRTR